MPVVAIALSARKALTVGAACVPRSFSDLGQTRALAFKEL